METVERNKEYTFKIESISSEGHGVARLDGLTVFIPFTAAGDTVRAVITDVQKRFARARLVSVTEPSDSRRDADCPNYGQCGGCQLRHISYDAQLEAKTQIVENAMRRIGGFTDFSVDETVGAKRTDRYRNKMMFPVGKINGQNVCGFYAPHSHNIIPLGDCMLGDSTNADIIRAVTDYMDAEGVEPDVIRRVFTRKSFATGEIMVVLCIAPATLPSTDELVTRITSVSDKVSGIVLNIGAGKTVPSDKNLTLWGKGTITDKLCGIEFEISPNSFFQINPEQTENLYRKAIEFADIDADTRVMDIYCGIGTISLCAAQTAKTVVGVEIVKQAIKDAKKNASRNGITNAKFYADSAENIVPRLIENGEQVDVAILDPPRKGSDEKTLNAIVKSGAKRIVYVSCNPATLARDARFLAEQGYKITRSAVFDLFPQTCHVETVLLMEK